MELSGEQRWRVISGRPGRREDQWVRTSGSWSTPGTAPPLRLSHPCAVSVQLAGKVSVRDHIGSRCLNCKGWVEKSGDTLEWMAGWAVWARRGKAESFVRVCTVTSSRSPELELKQAFERKLGLAAGWLPNIRASTTYRPRIQLKQPLGLPM